MSAHRSAGALRAIYVLANEELLGYEGKHGMRCLCHLLWYRAGVGPVVCIVGNFDGGFGTSTTNAIEVVATAVADRLKRSAFRLIEWYPHDAELRFSEVALTEVPPRPIQQGQVIVADEQGDQPLPRIKTLVRFVAPQWTRLTEDELAVVLGEAAIRDLRSFAGMPGDYVPERLFGNHGTQLGEAVRAHNRHIAETRQAQLEEWSDR